MLPCSGCFRHIHATEASCPFCATPLEFAPPPARARAGGGAFALVVTLLLGSAACSTDASSTEGQTTTTTTQGEPTTETIGDESTTQESTGSEGEMEETEDPPNTSGSFYAPASDIGPVGECDPFMQDCPDGEKCVPFLEEGDPGPYGTNKCVPVIGAEEPGSPCTSEGVFEAVDDCDETSICFPLDADGTTGTCTALCTGTADNPVCEPGTGCFVAYDGSVNACLPACDPLLQDCAPGEACYWASTDFLCLPPAEDAGALGDACDTITGCDGGNLCISGEVQANCSDANCCTELCPRSDPDFACSDPDYVCEAFFEEEALPPDSPELEIGVCIDPQP